MSRFSNSALLLIDIQTGWTKDCINGEFPHLATNLKKLVEFARRSNMLIVHIYADYNEDDSAWFKHGIHEKFNFDRNPPDYDIITPIIGEKILYKSTFDGFYNTTLHSYLRSKNIQKIYGAGVATSVCVLNTIHGAFIRGYKTFIVKDCCGDTNKKLHDLIIDRYYGFTTVFIKNNLKLAKL